VLKSRQASAYGNGSCDMSTQASIGSMPMSALSPRGLQQLKMCETFLDLAKMWMTAAQQMDDGIEAPPMPHDGSKLTG
jgi:hypothetical protein